MALSTPSEIAVSAASRAQLREEYKENYHDAMRANILVLFGNYATLLHTTDDAETLRKGLEFMGRTVGLEPDKKQDTGPTLQVIHFNIGGARSPVITEKVAHCIDDVRDKLEAMNLPPQTLEVLDVAAVPSELMQANRYINDEAVDDAA